MVCIELHFTIMLMQTIHSDLRKAAAELNQDLVPTRSIHISDYYVEQPKLLIVII